LNRYIRVAHIRVELYEQYISIKYNKLFAEINILSTKLNLRIFPDLKEKFNWPD